MEPDGGTAFYGSLKFLHTDVEFILRVYSELEVCVVLEASAAAGRHSAM